MKVKVYPNPIFDFAIGYMGGFDDVPTKQDKFKPIKYKNIQFEDANGMMVNMEDELYVMNIEKKENQKRFESLLMDQIKENIKSHHPYKKPDKIEVVVGINMTNKRLKEVDIDNLVKCILDCFNELVWEDDSQIASLIASKHVIEDDFVPQLSGIMIGVRVLTEGRKMLNNIPIFIMEEIVDEAS